MNGNVGILWRMETSLSLEENLKIAMAYHLKKTGAAATLANANADDLGEPRVIHGIRITPEKSCQKNHLFVGRRV